MKKFFIVVTTLLILWLLWKIYQLGGFFSLGMVVLTSTIGIVLGYHGETGKWPWEERK